ncbi:MAG: GNAT family N-acetyltransferase [Acidobacteriota bacterium]|nr:GNAT family N-acetyltransferase [Acidobacteriota bacterium]
MVIQTGQPIFTSLETERLMLRRLHDPDLMTFLAYLNDPVVARYQTWESYTEQQAMEVIAQQKSLAPGQPGTWFTFAVALKEKQALIGHIALSVKESDEQQAEVGFTFSREYQGQGFAREAAVCVLDYSFNTLKLHRVMAVTDVENQRSVALLDRLGMRKEGHFIENIWFKGKWGSEYLYAILAEEWMAKRAI